MAKTPKTDKPASAPRGKQITDSEIKYPRRTERRKRTRLKILSVAAEQFSKSGFSATTMQSIADEADIHVTTLFMHFNSKNELATSLATSAVDELRERALAARQTTPFFEFFRTETLTFSTKGRDAASSTYAVWDALREDRDLAFALLEYEEGQKDIYADYISAEYGINREVSYLPDLVSSLMVASAALPHRKFAHTAPLKELADEIKRSISACEQAALQLLENDSRN